MKTTIKNGETRAIPTYRNGCKSSERILWMTEFLNTETHTPVLSHGPPSEPTPARSADLGSHIIYTHFPKDRNCVICQRTKITRAPCRRRIGGVVPRAENFADLITADHKVLSEGCESRNNHRHAVVVQDLATQWIQSHPCKTKTSYETQRSLQKFLEPNRKPKVIYTDNSLEFGKACEDLSWNHSTSTPHRSETNGIAERAVRRVKEGTSAVLLQSGLNESWWGWFHGMLDLSAETSQTCCLMGRRPVKDALENLFKGPIIPFWFTGWVLPYFCERPDKNPSVWKESLTWIVPRICIVRGVHLEGWHDGCRHWGVGNGGRIGNLIKKTQCKGSNISQRNGKFIFPIADGRIKPLGGDQDLRTITLIRDHPIRGESRRDFLGESEGSPPPPQDSLPDAGEAINDFWSMSGNFFIYRHHVEPRVKLYSPREESFPIPLKYIDVSRTTHTNLDVMQERRIDDCWNIDGSSDLSGYWTGFHSVFTLLNEKPLDGRNVVQGETDKTVSDNQARSLMARILDEIGKGRTAKLREKQKWSIEIPKLDNTRRLRGIYFIDPEDMEFKEII